MSEKTLSGRVVLLSLLGFFGVIIGMNILMAWFAVGSFDGQVEENAYRGGLQFNQRIENARSQQATGWRADVALGQGPRSVEIQLTHRGGEALVGAALEGLLWRQSVQGMDVPLAFEQVAPGRYRARVPNEVYGRYELRLYAQRAGQQVTFKRDIEIGKLDTNAGAARDEKVAS